MRRRVLAIGLDGYEQSLGDKLMAEGARAFESFHDLSASKARGDRELSALSP